ncbi:MAG: TIGR00730 family Rossman fold protein [Sphaerochaetaceae bacterium]|nr:TIGR00730 family Rossman fold protein [Sphaerochaetaceae bacterium]
MNFLKKVAVFCGSSAGEDPLFSNKARELGQKMAARKIDLVYGGGYRGLMGITAEACYENSGKVIGVLPEVFNHDKVLSKKVESELIIVPDMHARKKKIYDISDAFVILPGGIGTLDEFFEIYTWRQIGYHDKNIALFNINGFYDSILKHLEKCVSEGFLRDIMLSSLIIEDDVDKLLDRLSEENNVLPLKY